MDVKEIFDRFRAWGALSLVETDIDVGYDWLTVALQYFGKRDAMEASAWFSYSWIVEGWSAAHLQGYDPQNLYLSVRSSQYQCRGAESSAITGNAS